MKREELEKFLNKRVRVFFVGGDKGYGTLTKINEKLYHVNESDRDFKITHVRKVDELKPLE